MSLIWPLGDALPPTAIIGRLTVDVVGHKGSTASPSRLPRPRRHHHRHGTLMVVYSKRLSFLTGL